MADSYYDVDGADLDAGGSGMARPGDDDWSEGAAYRLNGESFDENGNRIKKKKNKSDRDEAAKDLRDAEEGADNLNGRTTAREKEESGGIISRVGGKKNKKKGGLKGLLKKKGPMGMIMGLIFGGGGLMMGAQSMMPVAISELIIEKFNSIGISSTIASDAWLDTQLNLGVRGYDLGTTATKKKTTGGTMPSDYSDVTIIGDSASVDAAAKYGLYGSILKGADFGDTVVYRPGTEYPAAVGREYEGIGFVDILHYNKSLCVSVDTETEKNMSGLEILTIMRDKGDLREYVAFLVGGNDNGHNFDLFPIEKIDEAMEIVGPTRKVVFLTYYVYSVDRDWTFEAQNERLRNYLKDKSYSDRVAVADWGAVAKDEYIRENEYNGKKDYHFTLEGGQIFVGEIKKAIDSLREKFYTGGQEETETDPEPLEKSENLFAFSNYQIESFGKQGLKVIEAATGGSTWFTAILYKKGNQYIPVVGSKILSNSSYAKDDLVNAIKSASGIGNIGDPISAKEALGDPAFKNPYTTASKAWRGGVSGWFDGIMSNITETKLSITRNRWARYIARQIGSKNDDFVKVAASLDEMDKLSDEGISRKGDGGEPVYQVGEGEDAEYYSGPQYEKRGEVLVEKRADGSEMPISGTVSEVETGSDKFGRMSEWAGGIADSKTFQKVSGILNSKALKVGTKAASVGCGMIEAMASIYTIAAAYQNLQFLNLVTGFLEAVSKVKAGYGDESPINEYSNNLTTPVTTIDTNSESRKPASNKPKTAMESQGMASLFGAVVASSSDVSVQNVNFESLMSNMSVLTSSVQYMTETFEACGYIKVATSTISLVTTVISFIPVIGQGVKGAEILVKAVKKAAITATLSLILKILIPIATNKIINLVIKNAATEFFGEDLGNAMVSGASKYLGGNGTSGGQSPGDENKVAAYLNEKDTVIAEEAKYQRSVRSPFDMASKYTFLGSLLYSILPVASSSSFGSTLKSFSNLTKNSVIAVLPIVETARANSEIAENSDSCPILSSSGAIGDAFCNPIIITDTSTMGYSPVAINDIVYNLGMDDTIAASNSYYSTKISGNLDEEGKIKEGSNLAKYITYCGERVSPYGMKDANILQSSKDGTTKDLLREVPVIGDAADLFDGLDDVANYKWTTGQQCVASSTDTDWENEYKYYQRYAENMRLVESMNPGYESEVTAFMKGYYEKNPVDDSFEGQLARFSGMTREQVDDTLALVEYFQFLAEYDPLERYAFGEPKIEDSKIEFDNENIMAIDVTMPLENIIYADVRNRSFAI